MRQSFSVSSLLLAVAALCWIPDVSPVLGQGRTDYLNVESPQVHPIEVIENIGGRGFVLGTVRAGLGRGKSWGRGRAGDGVCFGQGVGRIRDGEDWGN